jgi:FlaA1/EpsC-like NDP-sugar epimerase
MSTVTAPHITDSLLALPRSAKRFLAMCVDVCLCVLTVWIVLCLRHETWVTIQGYQWLAVIISPLLAIPLFIAFGLYRAIFRFAGGEAMLAVARAVGIYALMYSAIFTTTSFQDVPRTIGLLQPALLLLCVGAVRLMARQILGESDAAPILSSSAINVLIYGAGDSGTALAASLAKNKERHVVGFLDDNTIDVYDPLYLAELVLRFEVSDVLLAMPSISRSRRNEIIKQLSQTRVAVRTLPSLSSLAQGEVSESDLREIDIEDLLGRDPVAPIPELLARNVTGKIVMVTGAGGSIGSELCRQIVKHAPKQLLLLDHHEYGLYVIEEELRKKMDTASQRFPISTILGNVQDKGQITQVVRELRPNTIYHAAAYKHVPMVEANRMAGLRNNVLGTLYVAQAALASGADDMVLISTDKAVRSTNIMGASKRLAEICLQALAERYKSQEKSTRFCIVRFGNVLGSSGSVVPKFREQVRAGGPVTVTHPAITRYFMTIPEAAQLVLQASSLTATHRHGAGIFLLDMGEPVLILDLAKLIIQLSGHTAREEDAEQALGDISITYTGLREGEKLYEELLVDGKSESTKHRKIFRASEKFHSWDELQIIVEKLSQHDTPIEDIVATMRELDLGYHPKAT